MSELCTVPDCSRPCRDAWICGACVGRLQDALRQVVGTTELHGLAVDLDIAITRQARMGSGGKRGSVTPLPWDQRAAEAAAVLRSTLVGWCRVVGDASEAHGGSEALPADRLDAMAAWLLARTHAIAQHEAGGEAVDEITAAVREVMRTIDRPAERWYVGPCSACGHALYAKRSDEWVTCIEHDEPIAYRVADRRDAMLAAVADQLATAPSAIHLLSLLDVHVTRVRLWRWAHGTDTEPDDVRLHAAGRESGRPLYRLGDVIELQREHDARVVERATRRAVRQASLT